MKNEQHLRLCRAYGQRRAELLGIDTGRISVKQEVEN